MSFRRSLLPLATASVALLLGAASIAYDAAGLKKFWELYAAKKYAQAADTFDGLVRGTPPDVNAFYYAGLANQQANRNSRAKQLFQYIVTYFPTSIQAAYAKKNLPAPAAQAQAAPGEMPSDVQDAIKASLPPEMRAALDTAAGKEALQKIMKEQGQNVAGRLRRRLWRRASRRRKASPLQPKTLPKMVPAPSIKAAIRIAGSKRRCPRSPVCRRDKSFWRA